MKVVEILKAIDGRLICGVQDANLTIGFGFASDLMSDVLTLPSANHLLITGLANLQTIRTAEMADISVIVFVRGKKASEEMINLATETGITLIETAYSMFRTSGLLYEHGLNPVY